MQKTILSLFNQRVEAERAREDLQSAGLSISDMRLLSAGKTPSGHLSQPGGSESEPRSLSDWTFGCEMSQAEIDRYHSYVSDGGKTLLSVLAAPSEAEFERIVAILEQHNPVDIGEAATGESCVRSYTVVRAFEEHR